jgi:hypothetical protein
MNTRSATTARRVLENEKEAMRSAVPDVLDARGLMIPETLRARVLGEESVERLRARMRRASIVSDAGGIFDA